MGKKRSDRKSSPATNSSKAAKPARSRLPGSARGPRGTVDPRTEGTATPAPSKQPTSRPTALDHLLGEVHLLIEFGESIISDLGADPHLNRSDRFAKLEAWLLVLTRKVFP